MKCLRALCLALLAALAAPLAARDSGTRELSSIGAPEMAPLVDALFAAFAKTHPEVRRGAVWQHRSGDLAMAALMFETADMAPVLRPFTAAELAPYDHQFRGDMMKAPVMVPVALRLGQPVWIAVNRRPGAPFASDVLGFLDFALSDAGQAVAARVPGFAALTSDVRQAERAGLAFYAATLDPAIADYRPAVRMTGAISSVGSDGMKGLMEAWMDGFRRLQPGIRRGERWEHLGTLNGFHALLGGLTDLAPMGREMWPQELAAFKAATGQERPLELRVARGGFNTPQRTTAQAIFVHADNPLRQISLPQLRSIMAANPAIARWGQLGATGDWAERPIHIYMPPPISPNAMFMQAQVLGGSAWNPAAQAGTIAETAARLAGDAGGIGFGGFEEGGPGLKALAVSPADGAPAITASYDTASSGRYPLTRYMFIRLRTMTPQAREFLRYVLSRQGQEAIIASGYFPLSEAELHAERALLARH